MDKRLCSVESCGSALCYFRFVESQRDPATDPVILWLNGGPGCSSLGGFFTELGPFRVNKDGKTLFENVYSWNKGANVIFLEAPHGVGYSYSERNPVDETYNDQKTATDNADAVAAFFERFPEYQNRPFFIAGESYAGIYVPTLSNEIVKRIKNNQIRNVNFQGFAVGNGMLNYYDQTNSVIDILYYRGVYGKEEFDSLQKCCQATGTATEHLGYCDFSQYIYIDPAGGVIRAKNYTNQVQRECANLVQQMSYDRVWDTINDVYNTYQDCYMDTAAAASMRAMRQSRLKKRLRSKAIISDGKNPFIDQGSEMNMGSTDAQGGFPCWMDAATENYLNLPEVRTALNIPPKLPSWNDCSATVGDHYTWQTFDTAPVFEEIFNSGLSLRILIYSGDTDTVCNFLGNEWLVERLSAKRNFIRTARAQWNFTDSAKFAPALGGYQKRFRSADSKIVMDFVTVKGAGHFVPLDRAGPSLQMIDNFVQNKPYDNLVNYSSEKKPLRLLYQPTPAPKWTRKDADRVWDLPGITYKLNFKHYSGYLNPSKGNYLHYWLVESQDNPSNDPLVIWFNGGPGCSSLIGMLTELGPFWPNPDGRTLMENVYSWNRVANLLFLESPRTVGYSYQNMSENSDQYFNDEKTAQDNFLAIMDFLSAYPEYYNRRLFVAGESYAGVYIPTVMDSLSTCCPKSEPLRYCDFSEWVGFDDGGDAHPINSSQCGYLVAQYGRDALWASSDIQDPYNMIQDCYLQKADAAAAAKQRIKESFIRRAAPGFLDQKTKMNFASTDSQGAFQCYNSLGVEQWLNWGDVRDALHIVPEAPPFTECRSAI
ncbi:unnamed protein product [Toxocara canis]|uniref:Carboxypeptidase n=1 Tax=Toxocara canis TaxID=6265 RepID=A0A3P7GWQ4_TOXCA|nr:unnamed protein product [Toxocara canis]